MFGPVISEETDRIIGTVNQSPDFFMHVSTGCPPEIFIIYDWLHAVMKVVLIYLKPTVLENLWLVSNLPFFERGL